MDYDAVERYPLGNRIGAMKPGFSFGLHTPKPGISVKKLDADEGSKLRADMTTPACRVAQCQVHLYACRNSHHDAFSPL
jgi:hypothetical protein